MKDVAHRVVISVNGVSRRFCTLSTGKGPNRSECGGEVMNLGSVWKCTRCSHEDLTVQGHRAALRQLVESKRPEINRLKYGVTTNDRPGDDA